MAEAGAAQPPGAGANGVGPAAPLEKPEWQTPENEAAQCLVYLITFAAVLATTALEATVPLVTLEGLTREAVRDAVLDAVANPRSSGARGGRPRAQPTTIEKMVFLEEPRHFHVALISR